MTVCYLLQTHGASSQAARLVRTIRRQSPGALILVMHDTSQGALDPAIRDVARVQVLESDVPARRGTFSGLQPYLRGVEWLAGQVSRVDWVVYLSGQDYPVRPLWELEDRLASEQVDGFLPHWDVLSGTGPWGRSRRGHRRYFYRYSEPRDSLWYRAARMLNDVQSFVHVHGTYGLRLGIRTRRLPFTDRFRCYVGHKFHILSFRCASYLTEVLRTNPELVDYYGHTVAPDESVVQTVLVNSGKFHLSADPLRFVDHPRSATGHARVLTVGDLAVLRSGPYYLARRFDAEVDARILDCLDEVMATRTAAGK